MFNNKDMSVIAYANGFTLWQYSTKDPIDLVEETGYFPKQIAKLMNLCDIIIISSNGLSYIRQVVDMNHLIVTIARVN